MRSNHTRGFTLVELLVSLAIVGILLGLLIPAVLSVRERVRASSCQNSLRQMSLAMLAYESTFKNLPFKYGGYSMLVPILPYCEQQPLYDQISAMGLDADDIDRELYRQVPALYRCPSQPTSQELYDRGVSNYVANCGSGTQELSEILATGVDGLEWMEFRSRPIYLSEITIGLSNMAAFSEVQFVPRSDYDRYPSLIFRRFNWEPTPTEGRLSRLREICEHGPFQDKPSARFSSLHWMVTYPKAGNYNHLLPPNSLNCQSRGSGWLGASSAGSFHRSGANTAFCDGSVRLIVDAIDQDTWLSMGTRDGGRNVF